MAASHARPRVPGRPPEWGYSGICCAVDPLGQLIAESHGRTGRPQRLTVELDEALQRTYLLASVPSLRARRPRAYRGLVDENLQRAYLRSAPAFLYNDRADRFTVPRR